MSKKPTLEDSVKLALEAAEAANAVVADHEASAAAVDAAAQRMERTTRRVTLASGGAAALALVACVIGGMAFLRAQADMAHTNETLIEGLALFAETVDELQTAVATGARVLEGADDEQASVVALNARLDTLEETVAARVVEAVEAADTLAPQLARSVIREIGDAEARVQDGLLQQTREIERDMTEMFAAQTDALLNVRPAPPTDSEADAPEGDDGAETAETGDDAASTAAGSDALNPFVYP